MLAGQCESRDRVIIGAVPPRAGAVALLARQRQVLPLMGRLHGSGIVLLMALDAGAADGRSFRLVAGAAGQTGMTLGQGEGCRMLLRGALPRRVRAVARFTFGAVAHGSMRWILGRLVISGMAADASDRYARESLALILLVAVLAIRGGVHAHQGESLRGMQLEERTMVRPARGGVAALASRARLTAMDIRMTVGTRDGDVGEGQFRVAAAAGCGGMFSGERVSRGRMIESGWLGWHLPVDGVMAARAVHPEIAVGALLAGLCAPLRDPERQEHGHEQQDETQGMRASHELHDDPFRCAPPASCDWGFFPWHATHAEGVGLNRIEPGTDASSLGWHPMHGAFECAPSSLKDES